MLKVPCIQAHAVSKPGNAWRKVHGRVAGRPTNFSWLVDGALAGSGMPTSRREFEWVLGRGVRSIVTMTEDPLPAEWTGDVEYLHVPTPDMTAPGMDEIDSAVDFVDGEVRAGRPVMVHCAAGMGRAGTILACYLVKYKKLSAKDAIGEVRGKRPGSVQSDVQEMAVGFFERHVAG